MANDPFGHGQNLNSLLGKILRIDVSKKDEGLNYTIPKDNPFVGKKGARGEIWSYGWRNPWRIAFDQKTGKLWAGEVGQNLWEEINIVTKGGNYGWNPRESFHPFGVKGVEQNKDMIDPIWEYHHDIGKSITGGNVYRGQNVPQLVGKYVYADYVSGLVWALEYDDQTKKVKANYRIAPGESLSLKNMPVITFGEDEERETYFTDTFGMFYRFAEVK